MNKSILVLLLLTPMRATAAAETAAGAPAVRYSPSGRLIVPAGLAPSVGPSALSASPVLNLGLATHGETPSALEAAAPAPALRFSPAAMTAEAASPAVSPEAAASAVAPAGGAARADASDAIRTQAAAFAPETGDGLLLRMDLDRRFDGSARREDSIPVPAYSGRGEFLRRGLAPLARAAGRLQAGALPVLAVVAVPSHWWVQSGQAQGAAAWLQDPRALMIGAVLLTLAVVNRAALRLTWRDFKRRVGSLFSGAGIGLGVGVAGGFFAGMIRDLASSAFGDSSVLPMIVLAAPIATGIGALVGYYKDAGWVRVLSRLAAGLTVGAVLGALNGFLVGMGLEMLRTGFSAPSPMGSAVFWGAVPFAALLGLANLFPRSSFMKAAALALVAASLLSLVGIMAGAFVGVVWSMIAGDLGSAIMVYCAGAGGAIGALIGAVNGARSRGLSWVDVILSIGAGANASGMVTGMLTVEAMELASGRSINPGAVALGGALGGAAQSTGGAIAAGAAAEIISDGLRPPDQPS